LVSVLEKEMEAETALFWLRFRFLKNQPIPHLCFIGQYLGTLVRNFTVTQSETFVTDFCQDNL